MVKTEQSTCKNCEESFDSLRGLHGHLKSHNMRQAEYYQKYYPRYDKFSGEIIKFKNRDQYFDSEFNSRSSLKGWVESVSDQEVKDYCIKLLSERKQEKGLIYAPSQIELKSLMFPPLNFFKERRISYLNMCKDLGLKIKFDYSVRLKEADLNEDHSIYVDTREQKPLDINVNIEVKKLNYGDYTLNDESICANVYVERKSLIDFIGTLSKGYDRFKSEIERAAIDGAYIIVVVESPYNTAYNFNKVPVIRNKVKATPEFIFHRLRELCQSYHNVQFLFVKNRSESSLKIKKILSCYGKCRQTDLQYLYDINEL